MILIKNKHCLNEAFFQIIISIFLTPFPIMIEPVENGFFGIECKTVVDPGEFV